ncbi:hypothetical protein EV187_1647 [Agromyces ramosus]|jgi:catechol 2,3-dioxygenase-like lactoylglutathione lyase family enzyme|uniref:VOC domain-containing protein n=1 Tax=Agromyces ramosus TaxID=33879 RepID=A0A4Q7MFQ6_9MICO|nr:VOC family protein [Agromyces ramosus]RZS65938.1 hypothetical protein EV187_1647 [Agromyces ramosus]
MQLQFLYVPVADLTSAVAFYRDELGWEEAWRESDDTVAFAVPGSSVQVMVSTAPGSAGPMYEVDDLEAFLASHPSVPRRGDTSEIPDGRVVELEGPGGNAFHVFDQVDAASGA